MQVYRIVDARYGRIGGFLSTLRSLGCETTLNKVSGVWYVFDPTNDALVGELVDRIRNSGSEIDIFVMGC